LLVSKQEFWGRITDYNERQRFYKDEIYIVWRTTAPYIYKNIVTRNENTYYFSRSLTTGIFPLLIENIEPAIADTAQQGILKRFVAEHKVGEKVVYRNEPSSPYREIKDDYGDMIKFICGILYAFLAK
jgi:hypothetical protein